MAPREIETVPLNHIVSRNSVWRANLRTTTTEYMTTQVRLRRPASGRNRQRAACKQCGGRFVFDVLSLPILRQRIRRLQFAGLASALLALVSIVAVPVLAGFDPIGSGIMALLCPLLMIFGGTAVGLGVAAGHQNGIRFQADSLVAGAHTIKPVPGKPVQRSGFLYEFPHGVGR